MADENCEDGKKPKDLEAQIKTALSQFKSPTTSNFCRDSLMTISTQNYREYLRLSMNYNISIKKIKSVTEVYLGMLNEWIERGAK